MENYAQFLQDLDHRYQDLLFTKSQLTLSTESTDGEEKEEELSGDSGYSAISIDNIDSFIKETEIMLNSLRARVSLERAAHEKVMHKSFSVSADRRDSKEDVGLEMANPKPAPPVQVLPFSIMKKRKRKNTSFFFFFSLKPKFLRTFHKTTRFDEKLRTIEELCGQGFQLSMTKLLKILSCYKRENMVLLVEKDELSQSGKNTASLFFFHLSLV